jgi:hypothetical protein
MSTGERQGEGKISDAIRDVLARRVPALKLYRNSVGLFKARGFRVWAGLPKGSADLIGVLRLEGLADRRILGRFVALEVKRPGEKAESHQAAWLEEVRSFGGFAAVVCSPQEALAAIERAKAGGAE